MRGFIWVGVLHLLLSLECPVEGADAGRRGPDNRRQLNKTKGAGSGRESWDNRMREERNYGGGDRGDKDSSENWQSELLQNEWETERAAGLVTVSVIPEQRHVSSFLSRGMFGRFLFMNNKKHIGSPLSITVTPCSSIVVWSVNFLPVFDNTTSISIKESQPVDSFRTQRTVSFFEGETERGIYTLEVRPLHSDTYVHFYITTSPDFTDPFQAHLGGNGGEGRSHSYNFISSAQLFLKPTIRVKRLRGNRIQVKWDTSPLNPHRMTYCIVVNSRRDYASLCGAQGDKYGVVPPDLRHLPYYYYKRNETETMLEEVDNDIRSNSKYEDMIIGCLNRKTNYILTDLQEGRLYYFNVFIKDGLTNLSYPYVRTTLKYQIPKTGPNLIHDSKAVKVNLMNEKRTTTVKFNLKKPCSELTLYIMPCGGGSITYKLLNGNQSVYESDGAVDNLDILKIAMPQRGSYYLKISHLSTVAKARMAEVFVSKKNRKFPLPKLPAITKLTEIISERRCDSVTIQWYASPDPRDNEYCIFLKEETRKQEFYFKKPNQCDVERALQSDPYVSHSMCLQKSPEPDDIALRQRIIGLQSAKTYIVQLIVRRHNGKSLSYDLHFVTTAKECFEKRR